MRRLIASIALALFIVTLGCSPEQKLNSKKNDPKDGIPGAAGMKAGGKAVADDKKDDVKDPKKDDKKDDAKDMKKDEAKDPKKDDAKDPKKDDKSK